MKLSHQQEAYVASCLKGESNMLSSCAGSGKTTTLVEGANALPHSDIIAAAFGKDIAKELERVLSRGVICKTMNSLGLAAWKNHIGRFPDINQYKLWDIKKDLGYGDEGYDDLVQVVSVVRRNGATVPGAPMRPRPLIKLDRSDWISIAKDCMVDPGEIGMERFVDAGQEVLKQSCILSFKGKIDFDDMVYMPVLWQSKFRTAKAVFVDEAQDLDPLQHRLVGKLVKPGGTLHAIGDPHQAIYGFRGADYQSMGNLQDLYDLERYELTVSYRCPQLVVEEAQQYVDHIEAHPDAPMGEILRPGKDFQLSQFERGDAVICRNAYPLIKLALYFLKEGISFRFLGRDIGKGLVKIVKRKEFKEIETCAPLAKAIQEWVFEEALALQGVGKKGQAQALRDRAEGVIVMALDMPSSSKQDLIRAIERLFDSNRPADITLCTGHKSKGLEWPRVWHLDSWRIPSKWAKTSGELEQENNLAYVITTRAKHTLGYVSLNQIIKEEAQAS